jgi:hypothetical protein
MEGVGRRREVVGAAALAALVTVAAAAHLRLSEPPPARDAAAELVYLPDARLLRPLGLGYDNVLADVLWFRTIDYFGRHYESDRLYPWLAKMCDIVTDLDPRAEHVYRFAGVVLPWEANEVDEGIQLLEKGLRTFPESWMLHYYLGMNHYFFKDEYGVAAEHLRRAAELPGAPPAVAGIAAVLHAEQHGPETTLEFLREMYRQAGSEQMREVIARSLQDAQLAVDVKRLEALVATYRERFGQAPATLEALVAAGLLRGTPPDPFGGVYEIDPATGAVRSSTGRTPRHLRESPGRRRRLGAPPGAGGS